MRRAAREDDGFALIAVLMAMAIVLMMGFATLSFVESQQRESVEVRVRETAFNLAEAALNAQTFALAQEWPGVGKALTPYTPCTPASVSTRCPSAAGLQGLATSADTAGGLSWETVVRDNGGAAATFYSEAVTAAQPGYDANADGRLWVRATATASGKTRAIVSLVRVEELQEDMPRAAVLAGRLEISNNGKKVIVEAGAGGGAVPTVAVRCTMALLEIEPCLGHRAGGPGFGTIAAVLGLLTNQLAPNITQQGYTGGDALTVEARARLKATAIADGTYHAVCPSSPPAGRVVWIASGACSWTGNTKIGTTAAPTLMILENATLYLGGTVELYGVAYAINPTDSGATAIQVQGNAQIFGGALIDGPGKLIAGSSKFNVTLALGAFGQARSYVSAGLVQNTWREVRPGV